MKSKKKVILGTALAVSVLILGIFIILNNQGTKEIKTDALKFKEEYEALNNTIRESGDKYNNITIENDNPMIYITIEEAIDILENKKGIIYIGASWCPWCRNAVPVMIDVAKDLNIDTIYYLNIDEEKSNFKIEDGKLVEMNPGTDNYYKLLEILKEHLQDYILTDEDGKTYDTKEKRIYMPYVLTTKNGKVVADHLSTVKLEKEQTKYDTLTEEQYKELYNIYYKMFDDLYNSSKTCNTNEGCS